jgi:hypothetical protein
MEFRIHIGSNIHKSGYLNANPDPTGQFNFNGFAVSLKVELHFCSEEVPQMVEKFFCIFFGGLQCVGHSFAYVTYF